MYHNLYVIIDIMHRFEFLGNVANIHDNTFSDLSANHCAMSHACYVGDMKLVTELIAVSDSINGTKNLYFGEGMVAACEGNHIEIVKMMIEKGTNFYAHGIEAACLGGNNDIVEFMLKYNKTNKYIS